MTASAAPACDGSPDTAWAGYLARMEPVMPVAVAAARDLWGRLRDLAPEAPPPQTAPTEDGVLSMVWDAGEHHVEVDAAPDQAIGLFYVNRSTGAFETQDGHADVERIARRVAELLRSGAP